MPLWRRERYCRKASKQQAKRGCTHPSPEMHPLSSSLLPSLFYFRNTCQNALFQLHPFPSPSLLFSSPRVKRTYIPPSHLTNPILPNQTIGRIDFMRCAATKIQPADPHTQPTCRFPTKVGPAARDTSTHFQAIGEECTGLDVEM